MTNVKPIPETGELRDKIRYWADIAYEKAELTSKDQYIFFIPGKQKFEISDNRTEYPFDSLVFVAEYEDFVSQDEDLGYDECHILRVYRGLYGEWLPEGEIVQWSDELKAYLEDKLESPEYAEEENEAVRRILSLNRSDQ